MDFRVVSHKQHASNTPGGDLTDPGNEKGSGSVNLKHQRSGLAEDNWRLTKMPKPGEVDFSSKNGASESFAALGRSNPRGLGVEDGHQMLSFSRNGGMSSDDASRSIVFSFFPDEPHSRTGGGLNDNMRAPFARLKGPFTPSQWMELEHQALIFKHIVANVPVPSYLVVPIKKSRYAYGTHASNLTIATALELPRNEKVFKVYVYEEGEAPIFHNGPCRSIYSTEGRFINQMEKGNPEEASVYFMPFSVVVMVQHLYEPGVKDMHAIGNTIADYVQTISHNHPYWNTSLGAE